MIGMSSNVLSVRKVASMSGRWDAFINCVLSSLYTSAIVLKVLRSDRRAGMERCGTMITCDGDVARRPLCGCLWAPRLPPLLTAWHKCRLYDYTNSGQWIGIVKPCQCEDFP